MEQSKALALSSPITIAATNKPNEDMYNKQSSSKIETRQSCKTFKTITKTVGNGPSGETPSQPKMLVKKRTLKDVFEKKPPSLYGSIATEDYRPVAIPDGKPKDEISSFSPLFVHSDTFKCIMKEHETISFVKKVKTNIETELAARVERCAALKRSLHRLFDLERHLNMAIDGVSVQSDMDLDSLQ